MRHRLAGLRDTEHKPDAPTAPMGMGGGAWASSDWGPSLLLASLNAARCCLTCLPRLVLLGKEEKQTLLFHRN